MKKELISHSKFLSLVLRHNPQLIGLTLDSKGWADIDQLICAAQSQSVGFTRALLVEIADSNEKQRFAISEDGQRIRARQGHSISVELGLEPQQPPAELYHGTAERFLIAIAAEGLKKMSRQHVHLSADRSVALKVGQRHGKPIVLLVDAAAMNSEGFQFFLSENGVWLTDNVPAKFLSQMRT